jgi:hypothetical protein
MPSGSCRACRSVVPRHPVVSDMLFSPSGFPRQLPQQVNSRRPGRSDDPGIREHPAPLHSFPPVLHRDQPHRETTHGHIRPKRARISARFPAYHPPVRHPQVGLDQPACCGLPPFPPPDCHFFPTRSAHLLPGAADGADSRTNLRMIS